MRAGAVALAEGALWQAATLPAAEVYPGGNLSSAAHLVGKQLPAEIKPLAGRYFTRVDFARLAAAMPPCRPLRN